MKPDAAPRGDSSYAILYDAIYSTATTTYIHFSETDFLTHNTVNFYSGFLNEKQECKISEIIDNLLLQRS